MMQFLQKRTLSSLLFGTTILLAVISCNSAVVTKKTKKLYASEGTRVKLTFITTKEISTIPCSFQLFYRKVLFNNNGSAALSLMYTKEKHLRTYIEADALFGYFIISLHLNDANASDAGIYRCNLSCEHNIVQYISLKVNYPPSKAECTWLYKVPLEMVNLLDYLILQCTATRGYPEGGIVCYSQLSNRTLAHSPYHITGETTIIATFWFRKDSELHCCSVQEGTVILESACNDFVSHKISLKGESEGFTERVEISSESQSKPTKLTKRKNSRPLITKIPHEISSNDGNEYRKPLIVSVTLNVVFILIGLIISKLSKMFT